MVTTIEMRRVLIAYFMSTKGKTMIKNASDNKVFAIYTKLKLAGKV